jgi:hypothetical protein
MEDIMKKRLIIALAILFIVAGGKNLVWATSAADTIEEECRTWFIEQQTPEENIEQLVAECIAAEFEAQEQEVEQQEADPSAQ